MKLVFHKQILEGEINFNNIILAKDESAVQYYLNIIAEWAGYNGYNLQTEKNKTFYGSIDDIYEEVLILEASEEKDNQIIFNGLDIFNIM